MEETVVQLRRRSLLEHFSRIKDERQSWKVAYPLPEVLLLVVCATIAGCEDYDEIADWGEARLDFLRGHGEYYHGVPCEDWLRSMMNRIDPDLFSACFSSWAEEHFACRPDFIALDGKTSRRSHDRARGKRALHLVSAYASRERLVLAQEAVAEKKSELDAIPALLARLSLSGALVSIDAIACNPAIAEAIVAAGGDYLLAVKDNQPTLVREIESYFEAAPEDELETLTQVDKDHGRIETRTHRVSATVDWLSGSRRYPGEPRFPGLRTIACVEAEIEVKGQVSRARRFYISSALLSAQRFAEAVRSHWAIENSLHWVLDVTFKEDLSRLRKGHGARNMAVVRHFALNCVRSVKDKRSIKTRRKRAGWDTKYLNSILDLEPC